MAECDCGSETSCCEIAGVENCSCDEKSFAENANRAFFKATDCSNLCFGKQLVLCPEGEICAFITQQIESAELRKIKVTEKLFVFLKGWDSPKEIRGKEKKLKNIQDARKVSLLNIEKVSLKGISFSFEIDSQKRKGFVPAPF